MKTAREVAEPNIVLRCVVGSEALGLSSGGDRDEMGVCVEPLEYVVGNDRVVRSDGVLVPFEQWTYRSAEEREGHDRLEDQRYNGRTPPSQEGDLDLTVYSLKKYCRLAASGNPSLVMLLYSPVIESTWIGEELRAMHDAFASKVAGRKFLGYLHAQRLRLTGNLGQMRVTRTDLIDKYGYDTKYAMHAARLGYQGMEYMRTGVLELPLPGYIRTYLMNIREGRTSFEDAIRWIDELEKDLKYKIEVSKLPDSPDYDRINKFLVRAYGNRL